MATVLAATSWSSPAPPRRVEEIPPAHENQEFLAKYGDSLLRINDSAEEFARRFPVARRVEITRTRGL